MQRRLDDVVEVGAVVLAVVALADEVAELDDADDVVEAALVDRDALVARADAGLDGLLEVGVDGHRVHVEPRRHHLLRDGVVEPEDALEHLALVLLDDALALAGLDDVLDLVAGDVRGLDGRPAAGDLVDDAGQVVEGDDQRQQHVLRELQRLRDPQRPRLGVLDRVGLRRALAEQQHERRDAERRERDRLALRDVEREQPRRDRRHRDVDEVVPHEDGHEQAVGVVLERLDRRRAGLALLGERLEAVLREREHRDLRGREERRQPEQDHEEPEADPRHEGAGDLDPEHHGCEDGGAGGPH